MRVGARVRRLALALRMRRWGAVRGGAPPHARAALSSGSASLPLPNPTLDHSHPEHPDAAGPTGGLACEPSSHGHSALAPSRFQDAELVADTTANPRPPARSRGTTSGGAPYRATGNKSRRNFDRPATYPNTAEPQHGPNPAWSGPRLAQRSAHRIEELVVWEHDRLAFERLQPRLAAKSSTAARLATATQASFVVFDLLHLGTQSLITKPYRERRARLVALFDDFELAPPWQLCPATTDSQTIMEWLTEWPRFGIEGLCMKQPDQSYRPGYRGWLKYRIKASAEAVITALTGSIENPATLLLARFDEHGRLRYVARTTPLNSRAAADLAPQLAPADDSHPWHEHRPRPRWNPPNPEDITLVAPRVVAEFTGDLAQDPRTGVLRHLVRYARTRPDLDPTDTPPATSGRQPAAG